MLTRRQILFIPIVSSFLFCSLLFPRQILPQEKTEAKKTDSFFPEANDEESEEENALEEEKEKLEINPEIIKKNVPAYTASLKQLIEEAERWIEKLGEEIKDVKMFERNQDKETKAREHYAKATILYQQGKLEEAKKELEKVIETAKEPEMEDYIYWREKQSKKEHQAKEEKEKEKIRKLEEEASIPYIQALFLYKEKKYQQAYEKFKEVENITPDYKRTGCYLERIPRDIENRIEEAKEEELKEKIDSLYNQAISSYDNGHFEQAIKKCEEIISLDPNHIGAGNYLEVKIPNKTKASSLYQYAVSLYENKQYEKSLEKFKEAGNLLPSYSEINRYLKIIPQEIEKQAREVKRKEKAGEREREKQAQEEREREREREKKIRKLEKKASTPYNQALFLYKEKKYQQAYEKFKEVENITPDYKRTGYYLKRIPRDIENRIEEAKEEELKEKIDSLMTEAMSFYNNSQLDKTKRVFKEILSLDNEHKEAKSYLEERIPDRIRQLRVLEKQEQEKKEKEEKQRSLQKISSLYSQARSLYEDGKYQEAAEKFEEVRNIMPFSAPRDTPSEETRIETKKEQIPREKISFLYSQALFLYKEKKYQQAFELFKQIEKLLPGYRETSYYLKRISVDLEKQIIETKEEGLKEKPKVLEEKIKILEEPKTLALEEKEEARLEKASRLYKQAVNLYQEKKYALAYEKFKEVKNLMPGYKATTYYLKTIPQDIEGQLENKKIPLKERSSASELEEKEKPRLEETSRLYNQALSLYQEKKYGRAYEKFVEVQNLMPDYKATAYYLKTIPQELRKRIEKLREVK